MCEIIGEIKKRLFSFNKIKLAFTSNIPFANKWFFFEASILCTILIKVKGIRIYTFKSMLKNKWISSLKYRKERGIIIVHVSCTEKGKLIFNSSITFYVWCPKSITILYFHNDRVKVMDYQRWFEMLTAVKWRQQTFMNLTNSFKNGVGFHRNYLCNRYNLRQYISLGQINSLKQELPHISDTTQ